MTLNGTKCLSCHVAEKLFINDCGNDANLLESLGVTPLSRECHSQVTSTRIIHGHLRLYTRDRSIDHFRFDFVMARLRKGGSFRCATKLLDS